MELNGYIFDRFVLISSMKATSLTILIYIFSMKSATNRFHHSMCALCCP